MAVWITSDPKTALTPTVIALGNFDGVHRGHQKVIASVPTTDPAAQLTVVAFDPHPQEFFSGQTRLLLTPLAEKSQQLQRLGVGQLVLLPFNRELAGLSPQAFVEEILIRQLQVRGISVGFNFRFGVDRSGTTVDLKAIAAPYGVQVVIVQPETAAGERISSSAIRQALEQGDVILANQLLGRPYALVGEVVTGQQLGRTLGFPTANLQIPANKFLPSRGVYAVLAEADRLGSVQKGVMNLGYRPTVDGNRLTIEIHLLDWSGDLYGQRLTVHLQQHLRSEQRFASLEALKTQIQEDCQSAREVLQQLQYQQALV